MKKMVGTVVLKSLYPTEYEVEIWMGTFCISEKSTCSYVTTDIHEALIAFKIADLIIKSLDEDEGDLKT